MASMTGNDRRQRLVWLVAIGAVVIVIVGLWFALLAQNDRFGTSPDAVLDLGFGNESQIPDDAQLSFVDEIAADPGWVADGDTGVYRSTGTTCTATYAEAFVDPRDVSTGDDRATTLSFIARQTGRPISAAEISDTAFDFSDNGTFHERGADAVRVEWVEADGTTVDVQARANGTRGSAASVTVNCEPQSDGELGVSVELPISSVIIELTHDARPPNLFTPYEG